MGKQMNSQSTSCSDYSHFTECCLHFFWPIDIMLYRRHLRQRPVATFKHNIAGVEENQMAETNPSILKRKKKS